MSFNADHHSVQEFRISQSAFLARYFTPSTIEPLPAPVFLAASTIVFENPGKGGHDAPGSQGPPRVLLIQRAESESMRLLWETPGGGCDDDDPTVLHSCVRELHEESGLEATSVGPLVRCPDAPTVVMNNLEQTGAYQNQPPRSGYRMGGHFFYTRRGRLVCKFYFVVETAATSGTVLKLDPKEHASYVWATEEEVRNGQTAGEQEVRLDFTTEEQRHVVLEAFRLLKE